MTLGLIATHAGLLLFDSYLKPGLAGIAVPFALEHWPPFTGLGIIAGWLAAILGLSFYVRKRIGVKTWGVMHRFTIVIYLLALIHVTGSGTDARSPWMIAMLTALTAPIAFAFTYRILPSLRARPSAGRRLSRPGSRRRPRYATRRWVARPRGPESRALCRPVFARACTPMPPARTRATAG